jgi:hypothetical protein
MTDHGWNGTERRPIQVSTQRPAFQGVGDAYELEPRAFGGRPERLPAPGEKRFYAVMAQPGHTIYAGSETPKLCVLYVTADATAALNRFQFATAERGIIEARDPIPPAIDREADRGVQVTRTNRRQHHDQVRRLHDVGGPDPQREGVATDA